jgi:hypothetical protein
MPQLDYAFLCDFVKADPGGLAHVIGAGIDTVYAAETPTAHNFGLLIRITFTQGESGRPHRVEVFFRTEDGDELAKIEGVVSPVWDQGLPPGWPIGALLALNFGLPLPSIGLYALEIMIDDSSAKSLNLRVLEPTVELPTS